MNPLFVGLLVAGVVLVLGVLVYNWAQERRLTRRRSGIAGRIPRAERDAGQGRAEPMLGAREAEDEAVPLSAAIAPAGDEDAAVGDSEAQYADPPPRPLAARSGRDDIAPDADIEC